MGKRPTSRFYSRRENEESPDTGFTFSRLQTFLGPFSCLPNKPESLSGASDWQDAGFQASRAVFRLSAALDCLFVAPD
jgi:hypothetical protein